MMYTFCIQQDGITVCCLYSYELLCQSGPVSSRRVIYTMTNILGTILPTLNE